MKVGIKEIAELLWVFNFFYLDKVIDVVTLGAAEQARVKLRVAKSMRSQLVRQTFIDIVGKKLDGKWRCAVKLQKIADQVLFWNAQSDHVVEEVTGQLGGF